MTILSNIDCFKELPYFNEVIEKPKIKRLKNDLLAEQLFYEQIANIMNEHFVSITKKVSLKPSISSKKL